MDTVTIIVVFCTLAAVGVVAYLARERVSWIKKLGEHVKRRLVEYRLRRRERRAVAEALAMKELQKNIAPTARMPHTDAMLEAMEVAKRTRWTPPV